jgi:hypothetical protein
MDDDKCGKFGSVKFEGRECASSLGSVKCTERPGISPRVCAVSALGSVNLLIWLKTADPSRGPLK